MTKAAKRRRIGIELGVGLLLPVLYVALAVVNQGHRYDIIQTFGPVISIFPSVLSVIFSTLPILLVSVIATVYAILCSYWLYLRRRQLSAVLSSSGSGINVSQYVRLFGLSCVEILWTVPVNWTVQMQNLFNRNPGGSILYPYTSWADVHYDFGRIGQYPIELLQLSPVGRRNLPILYLGSLSSAISCFLFFGFLGTSTGFTRDIVTHFSKWWNAIMPPKRLPKREDALSRRRPSFSEDLSHPPLSPNEELKMKHLDDSRVDDIHIENSGELTVYTLPELPKIDLIRPLGRKTTVCPLISVVANRLWVDGSLIRDTPVPGIRQVESA
ncbi:STE3-like pheromone receptor [Pseudozyma hubeiensis SY62]|uniref:STE3-like pheromone receptor n=1 Tax=Pseudozyma hubeiensis (strain SY62) TaxID=1305764 RepID=R9PB62_PSEHS|nr:STE3-like pheromone receptor [Pseudozyma hubeiensis SY62]GAC98648.1 STE3-like pheromone receptor [Pseudozyma hubeiensis SY62]